MLYKRAIGLLAGDAGTKENGGPSRKTIERRALIFWTPFMDRLEARTGRKIKNRREFCRSVSLTASFYLFEKACDESPTSKQVRIAYEKMIQHFDTFRPDLEGLLHTAPAPPAEPLLLASSSDDSGDRYAVENPIEMMKRIREDLDRFDWLLREALGIAREWANDDRRGGNRERFAMKIVIPALGKKYESVIGLRPGVSGEMADGGPFVAFVRDFLELVEPDAPKRSALYKTIKDILREDRAFKGNAASAPRP